MDVSIPAIAVATVAQFVVGGAWYSVLFGKLWGQIHGFDKLSPEVQKEMASKMGPFYGLQLIVTILTATVLNLLVRELPDFSPYYLAVLVWIGFMVPTQVGAVVFGGTEPKWVVKKLAVMMSASLACLLAAALVFSLMS